MGAKGREARSAPSTPRPASRPEAKTRPTSPTPAIIGSCGFLGLRCSVFGPARTDTLYPNTEHLNTEHRIPLRRRTLRECQLALARALPGAAAALAACAGG